MRIDYWGIFIGIVGLIFACLMFFVPVYNSIKYEQVTGVIIDDHLDKSTRRSRGITGTRRTRTHYTYSVDVQYEYKGVQYATRERVSRSRWEDKKPIGSELDVYVNPEHPETVQLLYGNKFNYNFLIFMIIYNVIVIPTCIKDSKGRNWYNRWCEDCIGGRYE